MTDAGAPAPGRRRLASLRPPREEDFSPRLRSPAVAARVGVALGVCFGLAFLTGLVSHYSQLPDPPVPVPTSPSWGYRVTQGLHVATGIAAIPLLLVKLWTVLPRLFQAMPRGVGPLAVATAERVSVALLVASAIFMLVTGLMNSTQWYPWAFSFRSTHYAVAWVAVGAIVLHVAVKLPVIRTALGADLEDTSQDRVPKTSPTRGVDQEGLSRRGLLTATWTAAGLAVLATAGATVPWLRRVSVLGVRSGDGPQGVPINRTASAAEVDPAAVGEDYRLEVVHGEQSVTLSRADLEAMEQRTEALPIACVEGWSAQGTWSGVRVRDLLDLVGAPAGAAVVVDSLQQRGAFSSTRLPGNFADDPRTLLALGLSGEPLSLDHGYPARIIAPNRPGVLQTKWVHRLEVQA
ncbi:molybdopterin-dependent oxidoreductase [Nocardioides bruguierae]|uniref:Molybdopterin-dependent oxidoreductase n=1 Tax=Nocardioides bruguierae TaxID=2945102 RepID=A0A9X2IFC3_9ACTN|nr:molybdopterin-dependent oxidoreductase [Nocardioides bruguierae]MCM0619570.1 molybdopterin-dependent oxidoreductase [Nocardioides bruguierae]